MLPWPDKLGNSITTKRIALSTRSGHSSCARAQQLFLHENGLTELRAFTPMLTIRHVTTVTSSRNSVCTGATGRSR